MPTNTPPEVESADTMAERIVSELSDDPRDEDFWTTVQGLAHAIGKRDSAVRRAALLEAARGIEATASEIAANDKHMRMFEAVSALHTQAHRIRTLAEKAAP